MSSEQLWKEYTDIKYSNNVNKKISVLTRCAEQKEDELLSRSAKRDLGLIYYQADDSIKDIDKAKKYLSEAADEGDENAKQFYGIILYNEGNFASFYYFCDAMELGNIHSAYLMYDNMHMKEDNATAKRIKSTVEEQIEDLVDACKWKIEDGKDEDGAPQFALALVGLYDLGEKLGIDRKKGQEYLKLALEKGNSYAQFMQQNPVLMKPETMNQYKPPTPKEMQKMDKTLAKAHLAEGKKRSGMKIKTKLIIALIIAVIAIVFFLREVLINAAVSFIGAITPILSIGFLIVVAYIAYGDDKGTASSPTPDYDPMKEYKENMSFKNMPSHIYDDNNNRWDKMYTYDNCAVYQNFDLGETTIKMGESNKQNQYDAQDQQANQAKKQKCQCLTCCCDYLKWSVKAACKMCECITDCM